ncbi:hypothetical protein E2562_004099 [Oryza meyeriana var. granulata]|uniref:Uncharacterized protein n=1 Tax=Oryza meyeriana var. granulata TaxID=110450 RepID=A0A6G1EV60_9ORYZ|nr:hypothetical protein E2562_004099 [Oryza meyeriana var. granulata]
MPRNENGASKSIGGCSPIHIILTEGGVKDPTGAHRRGISIDGGDPEQGRGCWRQVQVGQGEMGLESIGIEAVLGFGRQRTAHRASSVALDQ